MDHGALAEPTARIDPVTTSEIKVKILGNLLSLLLQTPYPQTVNYHQIFQNSETQPTAGERTLGHSRAFDEFLRSLIRNQQNICWIITLPPELGHP